MITLAKYFNAIKRFARIEVWLIIASSVFLSSQFLVSFILWHRTGDIPPGFGDAYAYVFGIEKVIKYHSLFPAIYYMGFSAHFTYIGYNFLMGFIGIFSGLSGEQVFHYSFYFGKVILLLSLIYFLWNLFKQDKKLVVVSLLFLAFFVGDGSVHGFFWVVPSFWMLVIFFVLFGIIFSDKKTHFGWLLILSFLYISIHPMSTYSIAIFVIFTALSFLWNRGIFKKSLKVTLILITTAVLFQGIALFSTKYFSPYYNKEITQGLFFQEEIKDINFFHDSVRSLDAPNGQGSVTDTTPNISFKFFNRQVEKNSSFINEHLPSFIRSWNSFYSWFFKFPLLLIILILAIVLNLKKGRKNIVFLFSSCLIFSLASSLHPYGERSIIFIFPITIILFSAGLYDIYFCIVQTLKNKILRDMYVFFVILGLIMFAVYGLISVKYYSGIADYNSNSEKCVSYIKNKNPSEVYLFFSSVDGINYFLNQGIEKYKIAGANHFSDQMGNGKYIFIVENPKKINFDDIDMPLINGERLDEILKDSGNYKWKQINCGIFALYERQYK